MAAVPRPLLAALLLASLLIAPARCPLRECIVIGGGGALSLRKACSIWHQTSLTTRPSAPPLMLRSASRPVLSRTLLAFDAKTGMAGTGMAGGYGVNGANVMQGVMARVNAGATAEVPRAIPAAAVPAAITEVATPAAATQLSSQPLWRALSAAS